MELEINSISSEVISPLAAQIKKMISDFCLLAQQHDIHVVPFSDNGLGRLHSLPHEKLEVICGQFGMYLSLCVSAGAAGISLKDSKSFVSYALKALGLSVPDQFLNTVKSEDIVEFYDSNGVQFFRNMSFFDFTNYSLSDIISHEWHELYFRPQVITNRIHELGHYIMTEQPSLVVGDLPTHLMKQILVQPIKVTEIDFKYAAPIFQAPGVPYGMVVSCKAKNMDEVVAEQQLDFI